MVIMDTQWANDRLLRRGTLELVCVHWIVLAGMAGLALLCLLGWAWTVRTLKATVTAWKRERRERGGETMRDLSTSRAFSDGESEGVPQGLRKAFFLGGPVGMSIPPARTVCHVEPTVVVS